MIIIFTNRLKSLKYVFILLILTIFGFVVFLNPFSSMFIDYIKYFNYKSGVNVNVTNLSGKQISNIGFSLVNYNEYINLTENINIDFNESFFENISINQYFNDYSIVLYHNYMENIFNYHLMYLHSNTGRYILNITITDIYDDGKLDGFYSYYNGLNHFKGDL